MYCEDNLCFDLEDVVVEVLFNNILYISIL